MRGLPAGYTMRRATASDMPAILACDRAASELFRPTGLIRDMPAIPESIPTDELSDAIARRQVDVMADNDGVVGFALTRPLPPTLYLDQVSVHPDHGRKGLGRALVSNVLERAANEGMDDVVLSTFRDLAWNGPFYRSMGFKELPRDRLDRWMLEVEALQAATMDVSLRCFMRRPVGVLERRAARRSKAG